MIGRRLASGPFSDTINIYAGPRAIAVGDAATPEALVTRLRRSGYNTNRGNRIGWYNLRPNAVEIFPGRDSESGAEAGVIEFQSGHVSRIFSLADNTQRPEYELEPQLITNLSAEREKRRLVRFNEIPPVLVQAVISTEDKHFFHHSGFDVLRILKAAYVDARQGRKEQGASTLTMQLARGLWLNQGKSWKRKFEELLITMELERRLTKQQIFEDYANQIYLGTRGTFSIDGFGEGARAFFGEDIAQLTAPQAALLAGIVQRPAYYNPFRYPERAKARRDEVLALMRDNGYLTKAAWQQAVDTPVKVAADASGGASGQYFVDLMNEELQNRLGETAEEMRYVYTTLDPELQQAAEEVVRNFADRFQAPRASKARAGATEPPQVALVALDPHTGEIRALVGGRNYGKSQLDRAVAMRQPGSVFKAFVYAAALETGIAGGQTIFTTASHLDDTPRAFQFGRDLYEPSDFHGEFHGSVTLRQAFIQSLNVPAVELAQAVGYDNVVTLAERAGINNGIRPTPSLALGSYDTTPLEIAGAYTMFANGGSYSAPTTISLVRSRDGTVLYQHQPDPYRALDPRVAYLVTNMMQDVLRSGTAANARRMGFTLPAAGKTGTSQDGWFAGFTSELLCVVWVGYDDGHNLGIEGAKSALPIWADFMKRAVELRRYRDVKPFTPPAGIVSAKICNDSGALAGPYCPNIRTEVFIDGTRPVIQCPLHTAQEVAPAPEPEIEEQPQNAQQQAQPQPGATQPQGPPPPVSQPLRPQPGAAQPQRPPSPVPQPQQPQPQAPPPQVTHPQGPPPPASQPQQPQPQEAQPQGAQPRQLHLPPPPMPKPN